MYHVFYSLLVAEYSSLDDVIHMCVMYSMYLSIYTVVYRWVN